MNFVNNSLFCKNKVNKLWSDCEPFFCWRSNLPLTHRFHGNLIGTPMEHNLGLIIVLLSANQNWVILLSVLQMTESNSSLIFETLTNSILLPGWVKEFGAHLVIYDWKSSKVTSGEGKFLTTHTTVHRPQPASNDLRKPPYIDHHNWWKVGIYSITNSPLINGYYAQKVSFFFSSHFYC